jgi:hypothetical protein
LSSGSREQICSPPAILLWSWVFAVLVYWGLVSLSHSLSLGQGQRSSDGSLLSACYSGLLTVFQFCSVIWLWMLLAGSGDELCGLLSALFQSAAYHLPSIGPSSFPVFVYWTFPWRSALCYSPPFLVHLQHPVPCAACSFSVLCLLFRVFCFIFLRGQGSICPGGYGLSQGWLWEYHMMLICSPVGLLDVCQAGGSWHLAAQESSCFLSVTWCGEVLCGLGIKGVKVLILLSAFLLPSVATVSQQDFWFMELTLSVSVF